MNIEDFFTKDEWNAIYNAMADYQDHGEEETDLAYSVQSKITELFSCMVVRTVDELATNPARESLIPLYWPCCEEHP